MIDIYQLRRQIDDGSMSQLTFEELADDLKERDAAEFLANTISAEENFKLDFFAALLEHGGYRAMANFLYHRPDMAPCITSQANFSTFIQKALKTPTQALMRMLLRLFSFAKDNAIFLDNEVLLPSLCGVESSREEVTLEYLKVLYSVIVKLRDENINEKNMICKSSVRFLNDENPLIVGQLFTILYNNEYFTRRELSPGCLLGPLILVMSDFSVPSIQIVAGIQVCERLLGDTGDLLFLKDFEAIEGSKNTSKFIIKNTKENKGFNPKSYASDVCICESPISKVDEENQNFPRMLGNSVHQNLTDSQNTSSLYLDDEEMAQEEGKKPHLKRIYKMLESPDRVESVAAGDFLMALVGKKVDKLVDIWGFEMVAGYLYNRGYITETDEKKVVESSENSRCVDPLHVEDPEAMLRRLEESGVVKVVRK